MLNIVGTELEKILLERANFSKEEIYSLHQDLDCGRELSIGRIDNLKDNKELIKKIKSSKKVRIWYSSINSEDQNRCLYLVNLILKNSPDCDIYLIDANHYKKEIYTVAACNLKEIQMLNKYQKKLTHEEIYKLSDEWEKLRKENADLRVIKKGQLTSVPYEELEQKILEELSKHEKISELKLIGLRLAKNIYNIQSFRTYNDIMNKLIKENKIQINKIETKQGYRIEKLSIRILTIKK
ncbi:MAG: DUF3658 domain-containing protein [Erysipelotrichaceae bacterium]|nr:DUF3658 domain-containing protein [Erysipelotrichaceae bacterium]